MKRRLQLRNNQSGAALVEFALMALVLYILVAGGIELGRMIFVSQTLQDAARIAARELSVTPLPAGCTFEDALNYPDVTDPMNCPPSLDPSLDVKTNIWNPNVLVLDISCGPTDNDLRTFVDSLPLVNRALRTIFISEIVDGEMLLRYPGALLSVGMPAPPPPPPPGMPQVCWPTARTDLTVSIPEVTARDANGVETIRWVPVLAEVRSDPASGPFSFNSMGPQKGIAAVAINYPFQSAALSGFRKGKFDEQGNPCTNGYDANGAPCANVAEVIAADDAGVTDLTGPPAGTALQAQTSNTNTTYKGQYGLGNQLAFAKTVRPYRSLLLGQAMFRREVIQ